MQVTTKKGSRKRCPGQMPFGLGGKSFMWLETAATAAAAREGKDTRLNVQCLNLGRAQIALLRIRKCHRNTTKAGKSRQNYCQY